MKMFSSSWNTLTVAVFGCRTIAGVTLTVPLFSTLDLYAFAIAAVCFIGMRRLGWGVVPVVLGSAAGGLLLSFATRGVP